MRDKQETLIMEQTGQLKVHDRTKFFFLSTACFIVTQRTLSSRQTGSVQVQKVLTHTGLLINLKWCDILQMVTKKKS